MAPEKILVIEDNPANMQLFCDILRAEGYLVFQSSTAQEGLKSALENGPYLILLDIQLPGMDGFAVLSELKAHSLTREIPVVALTSYAMQGDEERALATGFNAYITKPIDTRAFRKFVRELMEKHKGSLRKHA